MILKEELTEIGRFGKPHGIQGEINAVIDDDVEIDAIDKIVMNIDGIFVPFFIKSIRVKRHDSVIIAIDDVNNEEQAARFTNLDIYALISDNVREMPDNDEEGFYASDLVGYTIVHADGRPVGKITDINDSTENALFIVQLPDGTDKYIPIADELIDEINTEKRYIVMTLPEGLLDL